MVDGQNDNIRPMVAGEVSTIIQTMDWRSTSLGPIAGWPPDLRAIVDLILSHGFPMMVVWGLDQIQIYNDAYSSLISKRGLEGIGQSASTLAPNEPERHSALYECVWRGETVTSKGVKFDVKGVEPPELIWVDVCHSPIRGSAEQITGVLVTIIDVTEHHKAAIERASAEAALREREQALAFELSAGTLLSKLSERLVTVEDTGTIYEEILSAAISIMKSDAGTVQMYEPETDSLVLLVTRNLEREMTDHFHRVGADTKTACGIALRTGKRTFIDFGDEDTDEACIMHVDAGYRSAQSTPLVSRTGTPLGMINTHWHEAGHRPSVRQLQFLDLLARQAADLIDQSASANALRESEERFRQFGDASHDVLWMRDPETMQWNYLTPAFETIYGLTREEALAGNNYRSWVELIVPEDREHATDAMRRVRAGEHVTFEYRIRRPIDGGVRWLRNTDFPMRSASGELTMIGGIGHDITETKLNEERLERSEERLRSATEVGRLGLWDWNVATGEVHWSDEHFRMHGYAIGEVTPSYKAWVSGIHWDDRAATEAALVQAMNAHAEYVAEFRTVHPDNSVHWLYGRGRFFYDETGSAVRMVGAIVDTTERREWEERQKVLVAELQHRTRNLLGVVRSTASKTMKTSSDLTDFGSRFTARIEALARVQGLLSRLQEHDRVAFDELIRSELDAMGAAEEETVTLNGPPGVRLRSSTVQTLAMALHELATNSLKYGALGQPGARLSVRWRIEQDNEGATPWLHIDWKESGVGVRDTGAVTQRRGQGRELIERALPYQLKAKTTFELDSDGVHCTIAMPVSATSERNAIDV